MGLFEKLQKSNQEIDRQIARRGDETALLAVRYQRYLAVSEAALGLMGVNRERFNRSGLSNDTRDAFESCGSFLLHAWETPDVRLQPRGGSAPFNLTIIAKEIWQDFSATGSGLMLEAFNHIDFAASVTARFTRLNGTVVLEPTCSLNPSTLLAPGLSDAQRGAEVKGDLDDALEAVAAFLYGMPVTQPQDAR